MEVAIFVGVQGSGKSTFYAERLAPTHVHVSKDRMPPSARDKGRRQLEEIRRALQEGRSVAVDNTNTTAAERQPLIAIAREHGARVVGYWFDTPLADCLARNGRREGRARVPPAAIYAFARKLQVPSLSEGFDELRRVAPEADRAASGDGAPHL